MAAAGLYDPRFEHDACGVGFVADLSGRGGHDVVARALRVLCNLEHRGAQGGDPGTGDGAGILTQIPDEFFRASCGFELPEAGAYAAGMAFFSAERHLVTPALARLAAAEGLTILGWREVPFDITACGDGARAVLPDVLQMFVAGAEGQRGLELERMAFCLRKRAEHEAGVYFASLSARTIVYKGMLSAPQLGPFYPDLSDPRYGSALALVHSRFSTNTFPSWPLAHPYRYVAHNGEINTVRGNRNWMRAREAMLASDLIPHSRDGRGIERLFPVLNAEGSDSASFDECLELLHMGGRSLPHAVLMMIPEPWENHEEMTPERRAFYQFHAALMEPWDGPALIAFTDGSVIGAVLDRNGLRPGRYWVTSDDLVVLASEVGVLDIDPATVVRKGRLQPGRVFLADTATGRIVEDEEVKAALAAEHPYEDWLHAGLVYLDDLPDAADLSAVLGCYNPQNCRQSGGRARPGGAAADARIHRGGAAGHPGPDGADRCRADRVHGHGHTGGGAFRPAAADVRLLHPAVRPGDQPAARRHQGRAGHLARHDHRARAEPARADAGLLPPDRAALPGDQRQRPGQDRAHQRRGQPARVRLPRGGRPLRPARRRRGPARPARGDLRRGLGRDRGRRPADHLVRPGQAGSWRSSARATLIPIPSLLLTGAVHHHLIKQKSRTRAGLIVEAGDVRECHHVALLVGYGAAAVNPYLAIESVRDLVRRGMAGDPKLTEKKAEANLLKALGKGLLKIMSKMGVSTVASYTGAQIFEALGLGPEVIETCFAGTTSRLSGVGFDELAEETRLRAGHAAGGAGMAFRRLEGGGEYQWRRDGEPHLFSPETVFKLQHATRSGRYEVFKEYTTLVNDQSRRLMTLRGLLRIRGVDEGIGAAEPPEAPRPVRVDDVEPASSIVRRFATGAMSYGSISAEAHQTLAIAMNRLGGRSNTGEGGEDSDRFIPDANGDLRRSAVKQVASGRFGVTSEYLVNADDLQIKMAQGAKPGEGGQLPGNKVYPWIAKTRYSTPGVGLISPPPHHDIYSIEDLAQLIHDLKNANPAARVHVKLVSEVGVGTVAAGVSKAHADVVLISGHDGGTGAAPLTSLKHAGAPWELGLAETQQTLLRNKLRDRIVVQADGQLKTGRDVIIAALLGAEEFGFASAPLVVSGCVMMRVCHLDTCPVGVATQNPELRARFTGRPEFVVNFFEFIAEEVREYLARLGFRRLEEIIGRVDLLDAALAVDHWKASGLDLSPLLYGPPLPDGAALTCKQSQDHGLEKALDNTLIQLAEGALADGRPVRLDLPIRNVNRTVGTMLGYEVTRRWGGEGLPENTIDISFRGSAGQSFGAFLPHGITLRLEGDANDYLGKGLSGGRLIVRPPAQATFTAEEQVIAGNVIGYGATGGEIFLRGIVGERFCVRNSGALAVTEGTGDHGCEYMTGGRVVILGPVGRNFAAGMSGGIAYALDLPEIRVNMEMVDLDQVDPEEDGKFLREVVERHHAETGSAVAARLLADWDPGRFTKVMPKDYKRVLSAASQAEREGRDVNEAVMAAAHG